MLAEHFPPEFINRLDEIIVFHPLGSTEIEKIVDLQLAELIARLSERKLRVELTPAARQYLAKAGLSAKWGARPLRRAIEHNVLDPIARQLVEGRLRPGDTLLIDATPRGLIFETARLEAVEDAVPPA